MTVAEITRAETRQRARLIAVHGYEIELDVTSGEEFFHSETMITFSCTTPGSATYADLIAEPERISVIELNGVALDPAGHYADGRISLPGLATENTLRVVAALGYTTPGFHRSVDPVDGKVYTYTKFEPDYARQVFACFEQPDLKAPFTISVIAPAHWTVIATQPTAAPTSLDDAEPARPGVARWSFEPTPRLSTYLMHVTAGEYHVIRSEHTTARGQVLPMALASRQSLSEALEADAEEIFDLTRRGLDYFTDLFAMDFPFSKYDQQFVPNYPSGATEHPAAVTLEDGLLFRSRTTDAQREARASTILHEMAHMWFGDYVTMEWWDDLWLNESFAEWAAHQSLTDATRFTGAWTGFANSRKSWGYSTDLAPGTHPIAADVSTVAEAMANFDGISYAKGASVLRQLITVLGEESFIAGLRTYFAEHGWGNTTLDDFLRHLGAAAGRDLTTWSDLWLRTARPNTLEADFELDDDGAYGSFAVLQHADPEHPTLRPHRLAIGLYQREDGRLRRVHRVEVDVDGPRTEVPALVGRVQPDLLLLNDDDLDYVLIRFDERSQATLTEAVDEFEDSLPRAVCMNAASLLANNGEMPMPDYFRLAAKAMGAESSTSVVNGLRWNLWMQQLFLIDPAWSDQGRAVLAGTAERLLAETSPGSEFQLTWARLFGDNAVSPAHLDRITALYRGTEVIEGLELNQALRWTMLTRLAATGRAGDAEIDEELVLDPSDSGVRSALAARAGIPDAEHKAAAWELLTGEAEVPLQTINEVGAAFRMVTDPELLEPYRDRFFEVASEVWEHRKGFAKATTVDLLFPTAVVDDALFAQVDVFLTEHKDADAGLIRSIREGRDTARRAAASRALSKGDENTESAN